MTARPWHLRPREAREAVLARLKTEATAWWCGCIVIARDVSGACVTCLSTKEAHRAAIDLLTSACEFDDDALVVKAAGLSAWIVDWRDIDVGIEIELEYEEGAVGFWLVDYLEPLTPAAASLIEALTWPQKEGE